MPAHVTILYPFMSPSAIDATAIDSLRTIFERKRPFPFDLVEMGWFDDRILYLVPEPRQPFVELTSAVAERFPDYLPYRGAFEDIVPHLTLASRGGPAILRHVSRRIDKHLPISAEATAVVMMETRGHRHRWRLRYVFPLGTTNTPGSLGADTRASDSP